MTDRLVYLSGPMSGVEQYNFPAFKAAAADLRERGFEVISPAELDEAEGYEPPPDADPIPDAKQYATFLSRDIKIIAERRPTAAVVLPGWGDSGGAKTEVQFCRALGMTVLAYQGPEKQLVQIPELGAVRAEERITNAATGGQKGRKAQRFELLPWKELGEVAELYAAGAAKYADNNWRRGYNWSLSFGAMLRHAGLFWEGEDYDAETGAHHLTSVVFHALALLHFKDEHVELDDRPRTKLGEER